jgi:hypothetical protein
MQQRSLTTTYRSRTFSLKGAAPVEALAASGGLRVRVERRNVDMLVTVLAPSGFRFRNILK